MLRQRRSIVGLDLGSSSIKAVELTHDRTDFVVTGYAQIDLPNEQARQDAVQQLFESARFRTRRVATAVSGKNVIFRYINMVDMPPDKLQTAVRFEADKYIPFDVKDVEIDAQRLAMVAGEGGREEMKVLLVAARRSVVEEQARMLVALGLQPISVGVDSFAIGNAHGLNHALQTGLPDDQRTIALIDIGATKSSINVVRNGVTCFAREVPMGGDDLTNAIMRRLGLSAAEAEALKRDPGNQAAEVEEAVGQVLEDLGNEINLSFDFFENQADGEVQDVLLSGGTVLLPFLEENLERLFEKRTQVWNPVEGLKVKSDNVDIEALNQRAPQLAVAIGLAAAS